MANDVLREAFGCVSLRYSKKGFNLNPLSEVIDDDYSVVGISLYFWN